MVEVSIRVGHTVSHRESVVHWQAKRSGKPGCRSVDKGQRERRLHMAVGMDIAVATAWVWARLAVGPR